MLGAVPGLHGLEPVSLFPLSAVQLEEGPFLDAQTINIAYLLAHDPDRLLAPFRREAGLEPRAPAYPNWESTGLDGHTAGHYLTALAQSVAVTGHAEARQRLEYMIRELRLCQEAGESGYVGGVPGGVEMWQEVAKGNLDVSNFTLNGKWVPWYNLHKLFAGLRDVWFMTGNEEAREILIGLTDWTLHLVEDLSDAQIEQMLQAEHGGMNEIFADIYAHTRDPAHLRLARQFSHRAILDPLLEARDALTGLHANTQIPKVIGYLRVGQLAEQPDWVQAARFFWETVVDHRTVVIGGNSVHEHFHPRDDFSAMVESREGPETCNTYNMLKLTELLFQEQAAPRLVDYYERALFNHIRSSQHPQHGGYVYFTPLRPGHYRVYSQAEECFWCCVGSGMENHGRYGSFIYGQSSDALLVNLFIASSVHWEAKGVTLRQETRFPEEARTRFQLEMKEPSHFALQLRHPSWVSAGELGISINGEPWDFDSSPAAYVSIEREWKDGDLILLELPMTTTIEYLPENRDYVAFLHGPIVLAAPLPQGDLAGLIAGPDRMAHVANGPFLPLDEVPFLVTSEDHLPLAKALQPVEDRALEFLLRDIILPERYESLRLKPFYQVHDSRYVVYWRVAEADHYDTILEQIQREEAARLRLDRMTIDAVAPGEQQPEVEHDLRGAGMATGQHLGRLWRDADEWFGYSLYARDKDPVTLMLTFYGGEWGRSFEVLVNGHSFGEIGLHGSRHNHFIDKVFELTPELREAARAGEPLRLELRASPNTRTGRLFGVRLLDAIPEKED